MDWSIANCFGADAPSKSSLGATNLVTMSAKDSSSMERESLDLTILYRTCPASWVHISLRELGTEGKFCWRVLTLRLT